MKKLLKRWLLLIAVATLTVACNTKNQGQEDYKTYTTLVGTVWRGEMEADGAVQMEIRMIFDAQTVHFTYYLDGQIDGVSGEPYPYVFDGTTVEFTFDEGTEIGEIIDGKLVVYDSESGASISLSDITAPVLESLEGTRWSGQSEDYDGRQYQKEIAFTTPYLAQLTTTTDYYSAEVQTCYSYSAAQGTFYDPIMGQHGNREPQFQVIGNYLFVPTHNDMEIGYLWEIQEGTSPDAGAAVPQSLVGTRWEFTTDSGHGTALEFMADGHFHNLEVSPSRCADCTFDGIYNYHNGVCILVIEGYEYRCEVIGDRFLYNEGTPEITILRRVE